MAVPPWFDGFSISLPGRKIKAEKPAVAAFDGANGRGTGYFRLPEMWHVEKDFEKRTFNALLTGKTAIITKDGGVCAATARGKEERP